MGKYRVLEFTDKRGNIDIIITEKQSNNVWRSDLTLKEISRDLSYDEADAISSALNKLHIKEEM